MRLKTLYREIIKKGSEADIRSKSQIEGALKDKRKEYESLKKNKKGFFDQDALFNPFADTRILVGDPETNIKSAIVGIDVDGQEFLLVNWLKNHGTKIDLVISHHPAGRAYASFYEVMDLQVESFIKEGIGLGIAQNLLSERKAQVERRVGAANHERALDIAKWLKINFLCMHTPADNLAYQYIRKTLSEKKPRTLGRIVDILCAIPEYKDAAGKNNPPKIAIGKKNTRCKKIHLEFTGGTEGPKEIYEKLANSGIDTIIAMHQSEEHHKKCKEVKINVIVASHIASDNLGVNLILDHLETKDKLKIYEFSGFKRFKRKTKTQK